MKEQKGKLDDGDVILVQVSTAKDQKPFCLVETVIHEGLMWTLVWRWKAPCLSLESAIKHWDGRYQSNGEPASISHLSRLVYGLRRGGEEGRRWSRGGWRHGLDVENIFRESSEDCDTVPWGSDRWGSLYSVLPTDEQTVWDRNSPAVERPAELLEFKGGIPLRDGWVQMSLTWRTEY